ncbi:MAG TPA: hypothetical protein VF998_01425 [Candidatus Limnocylindria bacterium]
MSVDAAISRAIEEHPDLVARSARAVPKAWGALAAQGVRAFREREGRAPTDPERRAIWAGLWRAVEALKAGAR